MLSPERSIEEQVALGADMILVLDECTSNSDSEKYTRESTERTHRWAIRCIAAHHSHTSDQALVGIVQGGYWKDLRESSAICLASLPFDGIAIGGSLGTHEDLSHILDWTVLHLPENKPRHLLGVGSIEQIFEAVERGIDLFDCKIPTYEARHGHVYVRPPFGNRKNNFCYDITKSLYVEDRAPLDTLCQCNVCTTHSRSYVHHLLRTRELSGYTLASYHNLYFFITLMRDIRDSIKQNTFQELKREWGL